jgi:hypothetical protein
MKKLLSAALCLILTLILLPIGALAADAFDLVVTAGEHGTITIGDEPQGDEEDDARVSFRSDTADPTITIEAVQEGADSTSVHIRVIPDDGYEIDCVTLGDTVLRVGNSIGESPTFTVTEHDFGGWILGSDLKASDGTYVVSATFKEAEGPGGGDPSDGPYTITLKVGANGLATVEIADEPVEPDAVSGNIYTYAVPAGSDVSFTFTPDDGYIIDELRVNDGPPERADLENKFTLYNVGSNMQIEVSFMRPEEYTVTVPQAEHVTIDISINGEPVVLTDNKFTSLTRDMVRYYFTLEPDYTLKDFNILYDGLFEGVFVNYDPERGELYADVETNFNYTLVIETEQLSALPVHYYAIVSGEAGNVPDMKAAIRRELALQRVVVSDEDITIADGTPPAVSPEYDADYIQVIIDGLDDIAHFYIVDNAKTLLIITDPNVDDDGDEILTVFDGSEHEDFKPVDITIPPITSGRIYAFGPYAAFAMDMSHALGLDLPVSAGEDGAYIVEGAFDYMQWHVVNFGNPPDTAVNWYPTNVITADAMYIEAVATKDGKTQEAGAWAIDTSPRINRVDEDGTVNYRLEIFFGNDTVTLSPPEIGNVTGVAVREPSDSPGYTFYNDEVDEGSVIVEFLSDFYDNVTVPLTLALREGGTKSANVTIHRVGVEIQVHNIYNNAEGTTHVTVAHGTQSGSLVDLTEYGFRLTATYYIPDGGDIAPYGLFVTRTYANGRVETDTIIDPMEEGVLTYTGAASAVDYLIYSGPAAAAAPVSVSVLVLKDELDDNAFGGVDFGSGTGVTWTKN